MLERNIYFVIIKSQFVFNKIFITVYKLLQFYLDSNTVIHEIFSQIIKRNKRNYRIQHV